MEELPHCSVVLMKRSEAKVLRLNLGGTAPPRHPQKPLPPFTRAAVNSPLTSSVTAALRRATDEEEEEDDEKTKLHRIKHSSPASSAEEDESIVSFLREFRASTPASSSTATAGSSSPFLCEHNPLYESLRSAVSCSKRGRLGHGRSPRREGRDPTSKPFFFCRIFFPQNLFFVVEISSSRRRRSWNSREESGRAPSAGTGRRSWERDLGGLATRSWKRLRRVSQMRTSSQKEGSGGCTGGFFRTEAWWLSRLWKA